MPMHSAIIAAPLKEKITNNKINKKIKNKLKIK
jgi:hypothetical protein